MAKSARIKKPKTITAAKFDAMFDAGEDVTPYLDMAHATRPGLVVQRVNVDFPADVLRDIDQEARRLGVTRQAFIKIRVADSLRASRRTHLIDERETKTG